MRLKSRGLLVCRLAWVATALPACAAQETPPDAPSTVTSAQPPSAPVAPSEPTPVAERSRPAPAAVVAADPKETVPADGPEARRERLARVDQLQRPRPAALGEPARPSRLKPGLYRCSVGEGYKLRDCLVEKDSDGRTLLEIGEGNLISAKGVVWDEGRGMHFEGWLTDARPFGCFTCQDRCYVNPEDCGCRPPPIEVAEACVVQPISVEFTGAGNQFRGQLLYHHFWATYEGQGGERNLVVASREEKHPVRLIFSRPCSKAKGDCKTPPPPSRPHIDFE